MKYYPHDATTDTTVCPDLVDPQTYGQHSSRVIASSMPRRRFWAFESESGRNKFLADVEKGMFRRSKAP